MECVQLRPYDAVLSTKVIWFQDITFARVNWCLIVNLRWELLQKLNMKPGKIVARRQHKKWQAIVSGIIIFARHLPRFTQSVHCAALQNCTGMKSVLLSTFRCSNRKKLTSLTAFAFVACGIGPLPKNKTLNFEVALYPPCSFYLE